MKSSFKRSSRIIAVMFYVIVGGIGLYTLYSLAVIYCVCRFNTATDSMWPTMKPGTQGIINKMKSSVKQNDIFLFNYPYDWNGGRIKRCDSLFYVKRCVATAGDTLTIRDGQYFANGIPSVLPKESLKILRQTIDVWRIECKDSLDKCPSYGTIPRDSLFHKSNDWNIMNFGPLIVPRKGWTLNLDKDALILYGLYIDWETRKKWNWNDSTMAAENDRGESMHRYTFKKDYCFAAGDNVANSHDSRYFGFVPFEFIIGKVAFYW